MSEVKLYVLESDRCLNYLPFRPGTAEEIKAVHPKCGTCEYIYTSVQRLPTCGFKKSNSFGSPVEPELDYCREHTPKSEIKQNTD